MRTALEFQYCQRGPPESPLDMNIFNVNCIEYKYYINYKLTEHVTVPFISGTLLAKMSLP